MSIDNLDFKSAKSQVFYMDFIISILIFGVIIIIYFLYTSNLSNENDGLLEDLLADSKSISSSLAAGGFPSNWDATNVVRIGLTNDNQVLDQNLLVEAAKINYNKTKRLLGTTHDFFAFFQNKDGKYVTFGGDFGLGNPEVIFNSSVKLAYYYHQEGSDDEMLPVMESLGADIYFGQNERAVLVDILDQYDLILLEDCHCDKPASDDAIQKIEDYVSTGGMVFISEHHNNKFSNSDMGVFKEKGNKGNGGMTEATVRSTDPLLNFQVDDIITFESDVIELTDDPANEDAIDFTVIAEWTDTTSTSIGTSAIARWGFGLGTVYYFPDFHANYLGEEFVEVMKDAIQNKIYQDGFIMINDTYEDLVKIERLAVYNSEIVKMVVYVWA